MNASDEQPAGALRRVEGRLDLGRVPREGLLAQHVLARLDGPDRPLAVERVRERDVDGVDRRVGEELLVGAVAPAGSTTSAAYASARARSRLATPTRSTSGDACAPGMTSRLMSAVETIPHRTGSGTAAIPTRAP